MVKTDNDPNVIDLWHEGDKLPDGRIYNDDETIIKIEDRLYEGYDAFIAEVTDYPKNVFGFDVDKVTGVRIDGLLLEVFYKDRDGKEESIHFGYEHVNVVTLVKL